MDSLVCVGIITFNPDMERLRQNLDIITIQCHNVVLIDNASDNIKNIIEIASEFNTELISLEQNYGIAKALNVLMDYARDNGFDWAMSLDQDSVVSNNILSEYEKKLFLDDAAALCPKIKKININEQNETKECKPIEIVNRCPTTGFFCNVEKFYKTSGYDEWMFIDYVDYDICMKLRLAGYSIYKVNTAYVLQELGNVIVNTKLVNLGKKMHLKKVSNMGVTFNHSPMRNYYYVRNALYYIQKYKAYIDSRSERLKVLRWELKKLLLEKNRWKTIKSIRLAIRDYKKII